MLKLRKMIEGEALLNNNTCLYPNQRTFTSCIRSKDQMNLKTSDWTKKICFTSVAVLFHRHENHAF